MTNTTLNIQPKNVLDFQSLLEAAGFEQHDFSRLHDRGNLDLVRDIRRLVIGESTTVETAHTLPFKPEEGSDTGTTTLFRRDNMLWHNGRKLTVLNCLGLGVKTYAELASFFRPEAHPPEELLDFLSVRPYLIPANFHLHGEYMSWVIFMSTRDENTVHGLSAEGGIDRGRWDAYDKDGLEKHDYIIVYEDAL